MFVVSRSLRRGGIVLATLTIVVGLLGLASPASAAPLAAPAGLAPVAGSYGENPTLSWDHVAGATNYAVQVSATSGFDTLLWSSTTVNRQAVPAGHLPTGPVFWRVRGQAGSTVGAWSVGGFTRSAYAAPTGLTPHGTVFPQPTQPARLSWDAMSGATGYTVEVSDNADFTFITNTFTTSNTSVIVRQLLNKTYYWRVRASYGTAATSPWTAGRSFVFGYLPKPVVISPAHNSASDSPVLAWQPVPGAASYELQLSTSPTFATTLISQKGIFATSFAPSQGLAKGMYYWRVRPFDSFSKGPSWSDVDVWRFTRTFATQPALQHPANGATVSEPVFFQWSPIELAESYRVQLSTSSSFGSVEQSCTTVHTTYTPSGAGDCWPAAGGTYYWRVIGYDGPAPLNSGSAQSSAMQVRSFTYSPDRPEMTSPLNGSVSVPTLRWNPVYGAAQYRVTLTGPTSLTATTTATSFTPRTVLPAGNYQWQVQAVSRTGRVGPAYASGEQPTFTVSNQALPALTVPNPTVAGPSSARFPTLTWNAVVDATHYELQVRTAGGSTWTTLPEDFAYPAGEDSGSAWAPGTYEWRVSAFNGTSALATSSTLGTFTITALTAPTGRRMALTGTASTDADSSCATQLPGLCTDLRQTPVLSWAAHSDAVYYRVHLATNSSLTSPVAGYPKTVDNVRHLPVSHLADGTYHWAVQACRTASDCTSAGPATHAFSTEVKPLQLQTPAAGATVDSPAVTLTWRPYVQTNQDTGVSQPADNAGVAATFEAREYRVQVATDSAFTSLVSDAVVNQTQFTEPSTLYAPGTYHWRVRATDGSGRVLPWSAARSFTRTVPKVTLANPANGASVSGSVAFTWDAATAVTTYDFELYKDAAAPVKVTGFRTSVPGYVPPAPLAMSSKPYAWRVRPVDAKGAVGRWTAMTPFTVVGTTPAELTAPAAGVLLAPSRDALFTWDPVAGAAKYRFERRNANTGLVAQKVATVATAFAPPAQIGTGSWEWRVVALDAAGQSLGGSSWRPFQVDVTGPKVKTYTPTGIVSLSTNFKVTFNEPVTGVSGSTFTVTASGGSNALAATVTLDAARTTATLNPGASLVSGRKYVVRLTNGIADDHGNAMTAFSWTVTGK